VKLVKGSDIYQNVPVLTGQCFKCKTLYQQTMKVSVKLYLKEKPKTQRIYLNSAKYLKVGQSVWVDRVFSMLWLMECTVFMHQLQHIQNMEHSFGVFAEDKPLELTRRQIWHAFVQESTRTIAASAGINLELNDGLAID